MKLSLGAATLFLAFAAGCGSSASATPDDFATPSDENDVTKTAHAFACTSDSADSFDNLTVSGTGNATTITVKDDRGTYTAKLDPTYPNAKTSPTNKDYRRFRWTKDDPWEDSGSSLMLVHKDLLDGKSGTAKYQVTGETFENNFMTCSPKK